MLCKFLCFICVYRCAVCKGNNPMSFIHIFFLYLLCFISCVLFSLFYFCPWCLFCSVPLCAFCHFLWIYRWKKMLNMSEWKLYYNTKLKKEKFCICWMLPNATKYIVWNCVHYEYMLIVFLHLCVCRLKWSSPKWHKIVDYIYCVCGVCVCLI